MQTHTASAYVQDGRLFIRNRRLFDAVIKTYRDGEYTVTVERKHAIRSSQANRYWWGVCVKLVADHTGYTPEEVHKLAKHMFLPKELAVVGKNGRLVDKYVIDGTTQTLNKVEFYEFVEKFKRWADEELGVIIPEADDAAA